MNLKKDKSVENLKISSEIEKPDNVEEKKYNSINPNYQRSNKKRQNLRYDRKSLDKLTEEINLINDKEENSMENNSDENSDNSKNRNLNLKISNDSLNSNDLEQSKNNYKERIQIEFQTYKNDLKKNYIKKKKNFIDDFFEDLDDKKKKEINLLKEYGTEDLSNYEKELKDKMNVEIEKYKKSLINEYEQNTTDLN